MGHVWGIIWGMPGHHLGYYVWGIIWGMYGASYFAVPEHHLGHVRCMSEASYGVFLGHHL